MDHADRPMCRRARRSLHLISLRRRFSLSLVEIGKHIGGPRLAGTALEKDSPGLDDANLLSNGNCNPLVQRYAVFLRNLRPTAFHRTVS